MAPFIPVPNTLNVQVRFEVGGKPQEFGFNVLYPTAPTLTEAQALASATVDWVFVNLRNLYSPDILFNEVYVTDLTSVSSFAFPWTIGTGSDNMPFSGSLTARAGNVVGNQTALVASLRTPSRGRSFRGRMYMPVVNFQNISGPTTPDSAFRVSILAAVEALSAAINTLGAALVVVSRRHDGAPRVTGVATPVTLVIVDASLDTQRRRVKF